jgi:hypothetical protein
VPSGIIVAIFASGFLVVRRSRNFSGIALDGIDGTP